MLFDTADEEFDLPPRLVDLGDLESRQGEVIGQEDERALVLRVDVTNATRQIGITLAQIESAQPDRLIATEFGGSIDGTIGAGVGMQVRFVTDDEEGSGSREACEPREVQIVEN